VASVSPETVSFNYEFNYEYSGTGAEPQRSTWVNYRPGTLISSRWRIVDLYKTHAGSLVVCLLSLMSFICRREQESSAT